MSHGWSNDWQGQHNQRNTWNREEHERWERGVRDAERQQWQPPARRVEYQPYAGRGRDAGEQRGDRGNNRERGEDRQHRERRGRSRSPQRRDAGADGQNDPVTDALRVIIKDITNEEYREMVTYGLTNRELGTLVESIELELARREGRNPDYVRRGSALESESQPGKHLLLHWRWAYTQRHGWTVQSCGEPSSFGAAPLHLVWSQTERKGPEGRAGMIPESIGYAHPRVAHPEHWLASAGAQRATRQPGTPDEIRAARERTTREAYWAAQNERIQAAEAAAKANPSPKPATIAKAGAATLTARDAAKARAPPKASNVPAVAPKAASVPKAKAIPKANPSPTSATADTAGTSGLSDQGEPSE